MRLLLAIVLFGALAVPAYAKSQPRISREDARATAHYVYDEYAKTRGYRLVIGPCLRHGRLWRACPIRLGPWKEVLVVRYLNKRRDVVASARPR